jgi:superoxide dismutase, Fe-Mn family
MHDFREGVPGLLSPQGFDMAWTQYQGLMLEKLSSLTAGM